MKIITIMKQLNDVLKSKIKRLKYTFKVLFEFNSSFLISEILISVCNVMVTFN